MRPFAAAILLIPFLGSGCEFGYKGISEFSFWKGRDHFFPVNI
jgi:hypothetical protein